MTKQNKLIVSGVVVVLVGLYLYKQNKVKNEVSDLKSGADVSTTDVADAQPPRLIKETSGNLLKEDLKRGQAEVTEMSFDGKKSKLLFSTTF